MDVCAHFNSEEIQQLDLLQGGADLEKYGAPYYGKLWDIIESNPEVKTKTAEAVKELMGLPVEQGDKVVSDLRELTARKIGNPKQMPVPEPQNPEAMALASKGEEGDTEVAFMPNKMLQFFWDLYPDEIPIEDRINEETGLPEFWSIFDIVLPVLGGFVGNLIAPGIGSAIGAGLGSVGGDVIHNMTSPESEQRGLLSILGGGLLSGGMGYLGGNAFDAFGKGGLDAAGTALKEGMGSLPFLLTSGGGSILKGMGNESDKKANAEAARRNQKSGGNSLDDYNRYIQEARERDRARIDKYNLETSQHRESENKRLMGYQEELNKQKAIDDANEKLYHAKRAQTLAKYNARYHPLIDPQLISDMVDKYGVL